MGVLDALARHEEQSRDEVVRALRFYAHPRNYERLGRSVVPVIEEGGKRARKALEMMGETV